MWGQQLSVEDRPSKGGLELGRPGSSGASYVQAGGLRASVCREGPGLLQEIRVCASLAGAPFVPGSEAMLTVPPRRPAIAAGMTVAKGAARE